MSQGSEEHDAPRPQGQWALAWRRLKRDRITVACGVFLVLLVFAVGLGRTLIRAEAGLQGYDLPVILAVTLVAGAAIIVFDLIADLVVMALDPTLARTSRRGLLRLVGRTA